MIQREHKYYRLGFDEKRGQIDSLLVRGKELILNENKKSVFCIQMRDQKGRKIRKETSDFSEVKADCSGDSCVLRYSGCRDCNLEAEVTIQFTDKIIWGIRIFNHTRDVIEWVQFPQVAVFNDMQGRGGKSRLLWGFSEGVEISDPDLREKYCGPKYCETDYPGDWKMGFYPGIVQTQMMAYYDGLHGLYLAAHDKEGNVKAIDWFTEGEGICLQFRHFTGAREGENYYMPFPMVMDTFEGGWQAAADLYRDWAEEAKKEELNPISENSRLPEWYHDSPVVITYPVRGRYDTDEMNPNKLFPYLRGIPLVERMAAKLDSRILVMLMHWEGTAPWAPPYVWPPYGGEEIFAEYVKALHERGHLIGVYCSGIGWTLQSRVIPSYSREGELTEEELHKNMCISPEGTLPLSQNCTPQRKSYDMCASSEFTVQAVAHEVKNMADADIDYIQLLDQNHGGTQYLCYAKDHGHPPVPGKWQIDCIKNLLACAEKWTLSGKRKVILGCEAAAAEPYLSQLLLNDNRFQLNYGFGLPVPLYAYIFHEYINNFMGNQVNVPQLFKSQYATENLLYRIAYAFTAGDMLTLVLDENGSVVWGWGEKDFRNSPDQKSVLHLVRILNHCRKRWKEFLHYGKMVHPMEVTGVGFTELPMQCGYIQKVDNVLTSCWESRDGRYAQFLVNYTSQPVTCEVALTKEAKYIPNSENPEEFQRVSKKTDGFLMTIRELSVGVLLLS